MIPKQIHYIWLGKQEKSFLVQRCMATWLVFLKGWKIQCWNEDNLPITHPYVKKALNCRQYAFASDYLRFYILEKYGGVYLDTDVEIIANLEPFLNLNVFLGYESPDRINGAIIGGAANHAFFKRVLNEYDKISQNQNLEIICDVLTRCFNKLEFNDVEIFDESFFYPYNPYHIFRKKVKLQLLYTDVSENTVAIHHWDKSWKNN